ncbi:MAG: YggS family pyridoxal phosphate-dependent enzyme [Candidatus Acidiferrum sp.]
METDIQDNLARITERIAEAAHRAGRNAGDITLIGVSKTQSAEAIQKAFDAGVRHFGENRVQEWEGKRREIAGLPATWHLIGHLQSNKASKAAGLFHAIDAVDDLALAKKLDRACSTMALGQRLRVLIEVHMGDEATKSGVSEAELPGLAEQVMILPNLDLAGLMCIPPFLENAEQVRPYFARLRNLRDQLAARLGRQFPILSMGMSHDFEAAIQEGATEVRIGTAFFGARMPPR